MPLSCVPSGRFSSAGDRLDALIDQWRGFNDWSFLFVSPRCRSTLVLCLLVPIDGAAQTEPVIPRTPDGCDRISKVIWNFSSATPMERPAALAGKEVLDG